MKKRMVMAIALSAACMQGMESIDSNSWSITLGKTNVNVIKGSMLDTYAKEDRTINLMVLGNYQQQYVKGYRGQCEDMILGECDVVVLPLLKAREHDQKKSLYFPEKKNKPVFWTILEPYLEHKDEVDGFQYPSYSVKRYFPNSYLSPIERGKYAGDQVIPEASKDLAFCYEKVLRMGSSEIHICRKEKTIALPTLGTRYEKSKFAFPRKEAAHVAVKAVTEFIIKKPEAYDRIEMFVEKCSEFDLYKKLLEESADEK